jgi:hypothetical protein
MPEQLEIDRLRREVTRLKAERDKGRSLLREGSDMKFAFIAKHRSIWRSSTRLGHGTAKRWASPDAVVPCHTDFGTIAERFRCGIILVLSKKRCARLKLIAWMKEIDDLHPRL